MLYAKLEENHGLARRALKIYERATEAVLPEERYEVYNIFIKQAASMKGLTATREIFEKAIDALPDEQTRCVIEKNKKIFDLNFFFFFLKGYLPSLCRYGEETWRN